MSTYDVRIWGIREHKGKVRSTYRVRWQVAGRDFGESYQTRAMAESVRSDLVVAQRRGVAFDEVSGLPEPMARERNSRTWYAHAVDFVDVKWPRASAKHRKDIAETLAAVTPLAVTSERGAPPAETLRSALYGWSFNKGRRDGGKADLSPEHRSALAWIERNSADISALRDAALVRKMLDALALRLDGSAAAASTVSRKRAVLSGALRYAVELRHLEAHPFTYVGWTSPRIDEQVDRRVVVNPAQAQRLLGAIAEDVPDMAAFFGCMYYAALRPEEALHLTADDYERPKESGRWGWLHLSGATLSSGNDWTSDGRSVEQRGLKHRGAKATRDVPVVPALAALLDRHIADYPPASNGRLFVTRRGPGGRYFPTLGQPIPNNSYGKAWRDARKRALTPSEARSSLARRPYDLRHAAVSLWLNAGVPAPQVAEWAGHSVNVLMRVYARCIDGKEAAIRHRIEAALGESITDSDKP